MGRALVGGALVRGHKRSGICLELQLCLGP